jgi:hypothetical protein
MEGSTALILIAAIVVMGVLLFALITMTKKGNNQLDVEKYRVRWLTIERQFKKDEESSYHLAVLNADKLFDHAMKEKGFPGKVMADRLKNAGDRLSDKDAVWRAHKLRNKLAHEPDFTASYDEARRALVAFKAALKDLGAI